MKVHVFSLNELNMPIAAWHVACRREVRVLDVAPLAARLRPLIERIANRWVAASKARWLHDECPRFRRIHEYPPRTHIYDIFAKSEDWLDAHYGFDRLQALVPDYARAVKQLCLYRFARQQASIFGLSEVMDMHAGTDLRIHGLSASFIGSFLQYRGRTSIGDLHTQWAPHRALNLISACFVTAITVASILGRIRLKVPRAREFAFAADDIGDPADMELFRDIPEHHPILLVVRHPEFALEADAGEDNQFVHCRPGDGVFSPANGIVAAWDAFRGCFALARHLSWLEHPLFAEIIKLPFRRMLYRALFNRYRPRTFWGRDPYQVEHILRREELTRTGGESWGVMHSFLAYGSAYPEFRYIDFDRLFVTGRGFCERDYIDLWRPEMKLVTASTFRASREQFAARFAARPNDILIMCSVFVGDPGMVALVRGLATAFPDRKVYLQIKSNRVAEDTTDRFVAACKDGLDNVEDTSDKPYALFTQVRYAFSDPSGVLIEALQFGVYSFFTDVVEDQVESIYREMDGFSVSTSDQAVARIREIEGGKWIYPFERFGELIDLSGRVFYDAVRENLGLPAIEDTRKVWPITDSTRERTEAAFEQETA